MRQSHNMQCLARKAANLVIGGFGWAGDRQCGDPGDRNAIAPASGSVIQVPTPVRFIALDGLRGVAALWIVLFHIDWTNQVTGGWPIRSAYLAVDLFFILSGFVIFWSYGNRIENSADLGRFLRLRFFRIYPIHIAVLVGLIALEAVKFVVSNKTGNTGQPPFSGTTGLGPLAANILL